MNADARRRPGPTIAAIAASLVMCACGPSAAQPLETIELNEACSYFGEQVAGHLVSFASNKEAEDVIVEIVSASGLARNFEVRAAGVPNAAADIIGAQRFILYNPAFMQSVRAATNGNRWAPVSIMAHEIGHHLNGHTIDRKGSRPNLELEADYFSGHVLQRMGAKMDDAQAAMRVFGSEVGNATHPAKRDRLAAIASGWEKSCDADKGCSQGGADQDERPGPRVKKPPVVAQGPDSCEYAGDGECDEPDLCKPNTDMTDCRVSTRRRDTDPRSYPPTQPSGGVAQVCVTPAGACSMAVPIPVGSICTCYTPVGVFQGISR